MIIWLDAQLSPTIASWVQFTFGVQAYALRELGLREATDMAIFDAARATNTASFLL
jgi:predicted nuclease of predicted toxin-antitoxin system